MTRIAIGLAGLLLAVAAAVMARAEVPPGVMALSPEEREAVLDAASRRADDGLSGAVPDRRPHGEVGFEIGSRGERALFGSTIVPLGQNGMAAFSFVTGQGPTWRR
jgi:hypothetical protein